MVARGVGMGRFVHRQSVCQGNPQQATIKNLDPPLFDAETYFTNSYAPISHATPCGRLTPRWSVEISLIRQSLGGMRSMATLPGVRHGSGLVHCYPSTEDQSLE